MDKTFFRGVTLTIINTINFFSFGEISPRGNSLCVALGQCHALFNCAEHHAGTAYFQGEAS